MCNIRVYVIIKTFSVVIPNIQSRFPILISRPAIHCFHHVRVILNSYNTHFSSNELQTNSVNYHSVTAKQCCHRIKILINITIWILQYRNIIINRFWIGNDVQKTLLFITNVITETYKSVFQAKNRYFFVGSTLCLTFIKLSLILIFYI